MRIHPDPWIYKAAIISGPQSCELAKNPGGPEIEIGEVMRGGKDTWRVTNYLGNFETHDSLGNPLRGFISRPGYRLTCDVLPPNIPVEVVFAAVQPSSIVSPVARQPLKPGQWGSRICEVEPPPHHKVDPLKDFLDLKPHHLTVRIDGIYRDENSRYAVEKSMEAAIH